MKEERGGGGGILWGHKIKRSSMYIFNLSYGSKEWFSVLKVVEDEKNLDFWRYNVSLQMLVHFQKRHIVDKMED